MSVAFATRRMWLKRARRVGVALTWLFAIISYVLPPVWAFWFYRWWIRSWKDTGSDAFIGGIVVQVIVFAVGITTVWQTHLGRDATPEELRIARKADGCFDNTIVRRAAAWQRPITVRDIIVTQDDCAEMWDMKAREKVQADVLQKQLGK